MSGAGPRYGSETVRAERSPWARLCRGSKQPRGVAQLGSARRSGRRGRRFKSCHPDQCDVSTRRLIPGSSGSRSPLAVRRRDCRVMADQPQPTSDDDGFGTDVSSADEWVVRQLRRNRECTSLDQLRTQAARHTPEHPRSDRAGQSQNGLQHRARFEDDCPDEARPTRRTLHHVVLGETPQPWCG